jgi:hypothetical protein
VFAWAQKRYAGIIGGEAPLIVKRRAPSRASWRITNVVIGRDSRADANALCNRLRARGAACIVLKN